MYFVIINLHNKYLFFIKLAGLSYTANFLLNIPMSLRMFCLLENILKLILLFLLILITLVMIFGILLPMMILVMLLLIILVASVLLNVFLSLRNLIGFRLESTNTQKNRTFYFYVYCHVYCSCLANYYWR